MKKTYIATNTEAANLASGKQTAIVSLVNTKLPIKYSVDRDVNIICEMLLQHAPYQLGAEIYVREAWNYRDTIFADQDWQGYYYKALDAEINNGWRSPVTMPAEAARTRLIIGEKGCVRVHDVTVADAIKIAPLGHTKLTEDLKSIMIGQYIVGKFGQTAWDNNAFIFINKIEKI